MSKKIIVHDITYLTLLLSLLAGYFEYTYILLLITLIHELGHMITAAILNFDIKNITIYSFGGITKFNEKLNVSIYKELIVLIMGPITQIMFYIFVLNLYNFGYISTHIFEKITKIHFLLLEFNLLPVVPLDGGKILNLFLNYISKYKSSNKISIYISYLTIFISFIISKNNLIKLLLFLILFKTIYEHKNLGYKYNKFLLERKLYNFKFKRHKRIKNINEFYRNRTHTIKENNTIYTEKEYLTKYM